MYCDTICIFVSKLMDHFTNREMVVINGDLFVNLGKYNVFILCNFI
jgi:hypothetical protein